MIKYRSWALIGGFFVFIVLLMLPQAIYAGKLKVVTIPQEDQMREKGIMILCPPSGFCEFDVDQVCNTDAECAATLSGLCFGTRCPKNSLLVEQSFDPHAEYKIHFVDPEGFNVDPVSITCTVIQKDVCHVPTAAEKAPGRRQTDPLIMETRESEATDLFNVSNFFVCKYRSVKEGVGVLEVYYTGPRSRAFIGDHILKVEAEDARGNKGAEIQDICILGFPTCGAFGGTCLVGGGQCVVDSQCPGGTRCRVPENGRCTFGDKEPNFFFDVEWPGNQFMIKYADALWPFASCKNAALWQREIIGPPVNFCFTTDPFVGLSDP